MKNTSFLQILILRYHNNDDNWMISIYTFETRISENTINRIEPNQIEQFEFGFD